MSYQVRLEMFEGPLDLLLFLIKKDDLDVHNIPISHITKEYLSYLDLMKELNLDVAGEFLVMAATLMAMKAKALLPSSGGDEEEGPDPASELAQKLLEYQKFKAASSFLEQKHEDFKDVFFRGAPHFDDSEKTLSIGMFDLMESLREILERTEEMGKEEVVGEEFPIEERMEKILYLLENAPAVTLDEIFADERKRKGVIACFLAMLELIKLQRIFARQEGNFNQVMVYKKEVTADVR